MERISRGKGWSFGYAEPGSRILTGRSFLTPTHLESQRTVYPTLAQELRTHSFETGGCEIPLFVAPMSEGLPPLRRFP
jgi:hypothetical protein